MKDIPNGSVEYLNENNSKLIKIKGAFRLIAVHLDLNEKT